MFLSSNRSHGSLLLVHNKRHLLWVWRSISERLHGELAQRAEHQESVFLQDVGEACGVVWSLQGICILAQLKEVSYHTEPSLLKLPVIP